MKSCLNCNEEVLGKYCTHCGQNINVKRLSIADFLSLTFFKGIFHLDRGFLFTLKELFVRPGHAIKSSLAGQRKKYFNPIGLILILLSISVILDDFSLIHLSDMMAKESKDMMSNFEKLASEYPRLIALGQLPFFAISTYIFFRKSGVNFAEHLVMNAYKVSAEYVLALAFTVVTVFYGNIPVLRIGYGVLVLCLTIYAVRLYYQFFDQERYSKFGRFVRSVCASLFFSIIVAIISGVGAYMAKVAENAAG